MKKFLRVILCVFVIMLLASFAASSEANEIAGTQSPLQRRVGDEPGATFYYNEYDSSGSLIPYDEDVFEWWLDDDIPPEIEIDNTGKLTGKFTASGDYKFTIWVRNSESGNSDHIDFEIIVREADAGSADSGGSSGGCNFGVGIFALAVFFTKKFSCQKSA